MDIYFICLANSYKRGGRCVAGIEIDIDNNNHWTVKRNPNGSPKWIRPIAQGTDFGEIPEGEALFLPLLSVVKLTDVIPCPQKAHSEDVYYKQMHSVGRVSSISEVLNKLTDEVHPLLFYTIDYSISIDTYEHGDHSLMMVHPEGLSFHLDPTKNRAKYFLTFKYNGVVYDFTVTDPFFYQYIEQHPDAIENLSNVYLTLSLGLEYEGRHHKLIAAIIVPSEASAIKDPFVILQESLQEKSTRRFTFKERRTYKQCFVVPSQQGFAVCMKKRNGKEQFITIDKGCHVESWQSVNLNKASLIIYEDAEGNEVKRIRISVETKGNILYRILRFFFKKEIERTLGTDTYFTS